VFSGLTACSSGFDTPLESRKPVPVRAAVGDGRSGSSPSVNPKPVEGFVASYEVIYKGEPEAATGKMPLPGRYNRRCLAGMMNDSGPEFDS
jgi:hypothetical protein